MFTFETYEKTMKEWRSKISSSQTQRDVRAFAPPENFVRSGKTTCLLCCHQQRLFLYLAFEKLLQNFVFRSGISIPEPLLLNHGSPGCCFMQHRTQNKVVKNGLVCGSGCCKCFRLASHLFYVIHDPQTRKKEQFVVSCQTEITCFLGDPVSAATMRGYAYPLLYIHMSWH